jgi:hypothetical protein
MIHKEDLDRRYLVVLLIFHPSKAQNSRVIHLYVKYWKD